MVLIFAAEDGYSIEKVCRYLEQYQCDHLVIYETDVLQDMDVHFEGDGLTVCLQFESGKIVDFADIEAFWFYNGFFKNFRIRTSYPDSFADWGFYIQSEGSHLADFIHKLLANKPSLNNFHNELYTNKLYNLHMAAATGLCIPETWIVQSKEKLARLFSDRDSAYISKAIQRDAKIDKEGNQYHTAGINEIRPGLLNEMPERFAPSLVQRKVEKKYEVRTFFIQDNFFSAAIFSQGASETSLDFRHFNYDSPNRIIPIELPVMIKEKLVRLNKKLRLETGSIDLIYTRSDEYCFLEVNPIGKFGFISELCNFNIEQHIAKYLVTLKNGIC